MLDPLSIINIAGFAIQGLQLLLKSASQLEKQYKAAKQCAKYLRTHRSRLQDCLVELEEWQRIWGGFSDATYQSFWPGDVFGQVQDQLEELRSLQEAINSILSGKPKVVQEQGNEKNGGTKKATRFRLPFSRPRSDEDRICEPKDTDWEQCNELLRSSESAGAPVSKRRDVDLLFRVAFALYKKGELEEKIARMKVVMDELQDHSRKQYRSLRGQAIDVEVTRSELKENWKVQVS